METCYHCGDDCYDSILEYQGKNFCCNGCKTVYEIFQENDLSHYYELQANPGKSPSETKTAFDYLENEAIVQKLLEFDEQGTQIVSFTIPHIHCSSCIWVLENLQKMHPGVIHSQVNFPKKTVRITFASEEISLKELVILLSRIGYEPSISLDDFSKKRSSVDRSLIYKLGVAGFAFGNIMFLSFPEYFEVNEFWLDQFKGLFRWLMFAFSVPVVFYAAQDYFISAYKGLRSRVLNIDVPIAIGITVLFLRSTLEIIMHWGTGFFDSLAGLVFFLLLGKLFQQKTYAFLSFERDYKSYFPMAVTRLVGRSTQDEEYVQVYDLKKGDRILIRNAELIPADGILLKGTALIDYSFVTGEAEPVLKKVGDTIFAGGRQQAGIIEMEVLKPVAQSYLTKLWNNTVFNKNKASTFDTITNQISRRFTIGILLIAVLATTYWLFVDTSIAFNVFTAVLIVACPCALALAAPFTLGNMLRIFGNEKFYLKESHVIEQMAAIDTVVFDKTGTLTTNNKNVIAYEGISLSEEEKQLLTSTLRASSHPLSRALYKMLRQHDVFTLDDFTEETGKGIIGVHGTSEIKIGSSSFVGKDAAVSKQYTQMNLQTEVLNTGRTEVHIATADAYKGCYVFSNSYRTGMERIFKEIGQSCEIVILSGDNDGEKKYLKELLPDSAQLHFNMKPDHKLGFIESLQKEGKRVMMVGDGLNDAGALAQSDVGIVVSEDITLFSPACDGIMDATRFSDLPTFMRLSKRAISVIKYAFVFSLLYNLVGLGFAVSGNLAPVVAAILMPLSSISIVVFTTLATYLIGSQINKEKVRFGSKNREELTKVIFSTRPSD